MAYAKNNATTEGTGGVREYIPDGGVIAPPPPEAPTLTSIQPNGYNVTNTSIPCAGQVDNIGTTSVTEYGFYFGTDSNNYTNNTRYVVATNQNLSNQFGFVTDTSGAPFNLTLAAGTPFFITPFAKNNTGEGVGTTITQYTWNAWELRKQSDSSKEYVPYTSDSRTDNVYISTSSSSAECYTIMIGAYRVSLAGLPTISAPVAAAPSTFCLTGVAVAPIFGLLFFLPPISALIAAGASTFFFGSSGEATALPWLSAPSNPPFLCHERPSFVLLSRSSFVPPFKSLSALAFALISSFAIDSFFASSWEISCAADALGFSSFGNSGSLKISAAFAAASAAAALPPSAWPS